MVTFHFKRRTEERVEFYHILGIFSKHCNKWFIHWDEDKVEPDVSSKMAKVAVRMVEKVQSDICVTFLVSRIVLE